ncbi:MAG TPA: hypothetical protein VIG54_06165 [Lysobacter sp.]
MPLPTLLLLAAAATPAEADIHGVWMMCDRGLQYTEQTDPRGSANVRLWLAPDGEARLAGPDPTQDPPDAERSGNYRYREGQLTITIGGQQLELGLQRGEAGTLVGTEKSGLQTRLCPMGSDPASLDRPVPAYSLTALITREDEVEGRLDPWTPPAEPPANGTNGVWEVVRVVTPADSEMPPYGYPTRKLLLEGDRLCVMEAEETHVDPERCRALSDRFDERRPPVRTALGELLLVDGRFETYLRWLAPPGTDIPAVRQRVVLLERRDQP